MQKIDSKRILEPEAAKALLCPYLTEAHAERYCHGPACMAWRWRNEETQYRVELRGDADYLDPNGIVHMEESTREPAGWCGYNE